MKQSLICKNCIALPMCINRSNWSLLKNCKLMDDFVDSEGDKLKLYDDIEVKFIGLDRVMTIRRGVHIASKVNPRGHHTEEINMVIDTDGFVGECHE